MFQILWVILSASSISVSVKIVTVLVTLLMIGVCVLYFMFDEKRKEVKHLKRLLARSGVGKPVKELLKTNKKH